MTPVNIENSFVKFNEPETVSNFRREVQIAYPVYDVDDVHFMVRITGSVFDMAALALDPSSIHFGITLNKTSLARDWFSVDGLSPVIYQLSDTEAVVAWPHGMPGLTSTVAINQCFYIGLFVPAFPPGVQMIGVSNLFKRVGTDKLSVVIEYWSSGDAYGFYYCKLDPFHSKIRIPAYIGNPQFSSKEDVYRKSNGELVSLNSFVGKQYVMKTAWLPEEQHWPINVALSHESIKVSDDRYDMMVKKNGQYDISWPEAFEPILAPALVKLDQSGVPDASGASCSCVEFLNCEDVDLEAVCDVLVYTTHQIEVVSSCAVEDLVFELIYELLPGSTTVSSTGLLTMIGGPGVIINPPAPILATVKVSCGALSCNVNFYGLVVPCA
jgi:hypothetical protein